ncbi:PspA-associated protein PspAB [Candidatus Nitrosocosmicus sp. R]
MRGKSEHDKSVSEKSSANITNSFIDSDAIESLSRASIKLDEKFGLKSSGKCGICVKAVETEQFKEMKEFIDKFLSIATANKEKSEIAISYSSLIDEYGYLWFLLKGTKLEDLISSISSIGDTIHEKGFSKQLLATIFEFTSGYQNDGFKNNGSGSNRQYLIYNDKSDKFYPFVPISDKSHDTNLKKRNHDQEIKLMEELSNEIIFEKDLSKWFPVWNIPF